MDLNYTNSKSMEEVTIEEVMKFDDFALIWLKNFPVGHGDIVLLLTTLAEQAININQLLQVTDRQGLGQLIFTVPSGGLAAVLVIVERFCHSMPAVKYGYSQDITRIVLTGSGIRTHSQVAAEILDLLENDDIRMHMIGSSEISLSIYVDREQAEETVNLLRQRFINAD
ncbi:hypothetical protein ACFL27_28770 [candidate division CSSED10-310 bacterium]|uniref:aspartate kinase n=1 Tax=candidate division CSSED10-310 bacterium TaxID=2855610 RepID=A0ABV6Z6X1_UNCC1